MWRSHGGSRQGFSYMSSLTPLPPPTLGDVRVPGDGHRGRGDSALHVQGLLQPGGGVLVPAGQTQSLQL